MAAKRLHTDETLSDSRSRQGQYDELQKKTSSPQKSSAFDAAPPSRSDAQQLVGERKKQQTQTTKAKARTVPKKNSEPAKSPQDKNVSHHAAPVHTSPKAKQSSKTTARKKAATPKKRVTRKAGKRKVAKKGKKKSTFNIQLSLPVFIVMVVLIALLGGSLIAWKITDIRKESMNISGYQSTVTAEVTIQAGMSARSVAQMLESLGVITHAREFERYMVNHRLDTRIRAGTYLLEAGLTHALLAELLTNPPTGISAKQPIAVFAGFTIAEIDDRLVQSGIAEPGAFSDAAQMVAAERGLPFIEGWFLSGQYSVDTEYSVSLSLARTMQDALNEAIRPFVIALETLDITLADAIIIASLVQRETNDPEQMADIAGVIYNRLDADMPIGIDASLRYGLDAWDRPLTDTEITSKHPYNMRRIKGLPPTGVGSPSIDALHAAFYPATHNWLYYIHDENKEIRFAETFSGHQENIEKFLE